MFGRGFEAFGKPVPIRGAGPRLGAPPPPAPAIKAEQHQVAPPPPRMAQPQQRPVPPGRIQVYKKGDPNAPPCPICG